jgi:acyl transferase domain-containing protein
MQMFLDKLGALSSTSQCHVFGSDADGYGRGDGFVGFYLKDLNSAIRDNDNIQAVIRGTAANANGRTGGITHPSPTAQEAAMRKAYQMAGNLNPRDTAYYECHGTGTAVGDPIELKAIQSFFIGHGEPVSGLSGLLKVVLAIQRGVIPPMITPASINPLLNLDISRFQLVQEQAAWPADLPRRASVATSGFGGANAHVVVEEFVSNGRQAEIDRNIRPSRFLLPFSAHKPHSLVQNCGALAAACDQDSYSPIDVAYTLGRRSRLPYRGFAVVSANPDTSLSLSSDQLQIAKRLRTTPPRIGFICTGILLLSPS